VTVSRFFLACAAALPFSFTTFAELRRTLFPIQDESLFTGTHHDPVKLYKPMINAFNRAMAKHMEGESDKKL
jgi:hypothetical protein